MRMTEKSYFYLQGVKYHIPKAPTTINSVEDLVDTCVDTEYPGSFIGEFRAATRRFTPLPKSESSS